MRAANLEPILRLAACRDDQGSEYWQQQKNLSEHVARQYRYTQKRVASNDLGGTERCFYGDPAAVCDQEEI